MGVAQRDGRNPSLIPPASPRALRDCSLVVGSLLILVSMRREGTMWGAREEVGLQWPRP